MPLDPRIAASLQAMASLPGMDETGMTVAERRARRIAPPPPELFDRLAAELPAPVAEETDETVPSGYGGVPIRVYRDAPGVLPALLVLHGGGWWLGGLNEADAGCRWRAREIECVVVSVGYRLAPEHPFPAALDDAWTAARWVVANATRLGIDHERIAIGGSSAGANLAAVVTQLARDTGEIRLVGQILDVPCTDLTLTASRRSATQFAAGFGFSAADLRECVEFYLGGHDPRDPRVSPLFGQLHGLPPALINTCECDPLRDDGEAYAAALTAAGTAVTQRRWEGQIHGSMELTTLVPDVAARFRRETAAWLRQRLSPSPPTTGG